MFRLRFTSHAPTLKLAVASSLLTLLPLSVTERLLEPKAPAPVPAVAMQGLRKAQSEAFIENRGQWDAQAQFLARSPGVDSWVTDSGVVYDFHRFVPDKDAKKDPMDPRGRFDAPKGRRQGHVVRMEFVGGRPSSAKGDGLLEGRYNYFIGNDESKWASNIPRYSEVRSEQVYEGIEARWYFDQGKPRYDLIVAPGADPQNIRMRFAGANGLSTDGKSLSIGTSLGNVEQAKLFAYQRIGGAIKQVPCEFSARGNTASFKVADYDRSRPLVIDPLIWSSFVGGAYWDRATSIVVDESGSPIITGYTWSTDFPVSWGAYDSTAESFEVFVTRLSQDGSTLSWSTFLGGIGSDLGTGIVDAGGDTFVAGITSSVDFPTAPNGGLFGPFDGEFNGMDDVFVARLSSFGSQLVYSTYLGGSESDRASGIALDSSLNAAVVGYTESRDFPLSAGALDASINGYGEAFIANISDDGTGLLGSTFLGGSNEESATAVAFDDLSRIVVVGHTNSTDFPITQGSSDTTFNGGASDAFVARVGFDCLSLSYSTYLGGSSEDVAQCVALDAGQNPVVAGRTYSPDFPYTLNSYDPTHNGGLDAFATRLSEDGSNLLASTFIGGTGADNLLSVKSGLEGIFAVGETDSKQFPTTPGAIDTSLDGVNDVFVTKLSPDISRLLYSSFLGGTGIDRAFAVALDPLGNAVVTGETESADFPTTAGSFDRIFGGGQSDAFVCAVPTALVLSGASVSKSEFIGGFSVPLTITLSHVATPGDVEVSLVTDTPGKVFVSPTKVKAGKISRVVGIRTETVKTPIPVSVTVSRNGVSKTVSFTLVPGGLMSLKLNPTTLSSFQIGSGRVLLSAPATTGGRSVRLRSGNALLLYVPTEVGVPAGIDGAVFPTFAGTISTSASVTVTATLGSMNKTASMTVSP